MTENERQQMLERKRLAYRRRLQAVRDRYGLPALTNRQREGLIDLCMNVQGEGLEDVDLRVLHRLVTRGFIDN